MHVVTSTFDLSADLSSFDAAAFAESLAAALPPTGRLQLSLSAASVRVVARTTFTDRLSANQALATLTQPIEQLSRSLGVTIERLVSASIATEVTAAPSPPPPPNPPPTPPSSSQSQLPRSSARASSIESDPSHTEGIVSSESGGGVPRLNVANAVLIGLVLAVIVLLVGIGVACLRRWPRRHLPRWHTATAAVTDAKADIKLASPPPHAIRCDHASQPLGGTRDAGHMHGREELAEPSFARPDISPPRRSFERTDVSLPSRLMHHTLPLATPPTRAPALHPTYHTAPPRRLPATEAAEAVEAIDGMVEAARVEVVDGGGSSCCCSPRAGSLPRASPRGGHQPPRNLGYGEPLSPLSPGRNRRVLPVGPEEQLEESEALGGAGSPRPAIMSWLESTVMTTEEQQKRDEHSRSAAIRIMEQAECNERVPAEGQATGWVEAPAAGQADNERYHF